MTPGPWRLDGLTAIVTGAASGIGAATARLFGEVGATVVAADLDGAGAERTASETPGRHGTTVDITDEQSVIALVEHAHQLSGRIDILVNVAGIGSTTTALDTCLQQWEDVFAVNVRGTFLCCKHALPRMIEPRDGAIVNIASVAGLVGLRRGAAYCASKGAVIAFTRALAIDHVAQGVRVNCICPGTVDSPWVRRLVDDAGESLDALRARQPIGPTGNPRGDRTNRASSRLTRRPLLHGQCARHRWRPDRCLRRSHALPQDRPDTPTPLLDDLDAHDRKCTDRISGRESNAETSACRSFRHYWAVQAYRRKGE